MKTLLDVLTKIVDLLMKLFPFTRYFIKQNWDAKRKRLLKKGKAMELVLCTSPQVKMRSEQQLELPHLVSGVKISTADWMEAKQRIAVYRDRLTEIPSQQALLLSSNYVNVSGLFLFGWYINRKSGRIIKFERNDKGHDGQDSCTVYDLSTAPDVSKKNFFYEDHEEPKPGVLYRAIAVCIHATDTDPMTMKRPFEAFVQGISEGPVLRMRFIKRGRIDEKTCLPSAARQVADALSSIRASNICAAPTVPAYLCIYTAAQMAVALGMQLGNDSNLVLCGFIQDDVEYYEAIRLGEAKDQARAV